MVAPAGDHGILCLFTMPLVLPEQALVMPPVGIPHSDPMLPAGLQDGVLRWLEEFAARLTAGRYPVTTFGDAGVPPTPALSLFDLARPNTVEAVCASNNPCSVHDQQVSASCAVTTASCRFCLCVVVNPTVSLLTALQVTRGVLVTATPLFVPEQSKIRGPRGCFLFAYW